MTDSIKLQAEGKVKQTRWLDIVRPKKAEKIEPERITARLIQEIGVKIVEPTRRSSNG